MNTSARADATGLRALIEPVVTALGLDLFDVEFGGSQLRVTVERPGGVDLEAVAAATRAISRALDDADPIAGRYTLEVSSPGLERPLRTPAHFAWAVGREVSIKTTVDVEGERRLRGTVQSADDDGIVLVLDEPEGEPRRLAYDEIDKARTVFEWAAQPPRPKQGKQTRKRARAS